MNRRNVLGGVGVVLATALAGCSGDGDDDSDEGTDGGEGSTSADSAFVDQDVANGDEIEFEAPDVNNFSVELDADGDGLEVSMADESGQGSLWVVQPDDKVTKEGTFDDSSTFMIEILRGSGHIRVTAQDG